MHTRPLLLDDEPELRRLLMEAPAYNLFHLSALVEWGLPPTHDPYAPLWAVGVFQENTLSGAAVVLRGTGGTYSVPGNSSVVEALSRVVVSQSLAGQWSLLSGHRTQIDPIMPLVGGARIDTPERCHFRTLLPTDLAPIDNGFIPGFSPPRIATESDMEQLIDFYITGFYSLARLPSRAAWRSRLNEQLTYRSLFVIESEDGKIASAAQLSTESAGGAMLGGVATLPQYEGRGLSTLCVGALCKHLFMLGMPLISLFYLPNNAGASRVYEKLGFQRDGDWLLATLGLPLIGRV